LTGRKDIETAQSPSAVSISGVNVTPTVKPESARLAYYEPNDPEEDSEEDPKE
jgi:hypothetical protein